METIIGGGQAADAKNSVIKDSSTATFAQDVIEASMKVPVIVDFWAPWCGPCKQLTPVLEKAVQASRGAVSLVKINIDENQALAQQLRIQSIPMVYAFFQGRPVDGFQGAVPESEVKSFISRLTEMAGGDEGDDPLAEALEQAESLLQSGDAASAASIFQQVLQHDPENSAAAAGLLKALLAAKQTEQARALLDQLPEEIRKSAEVAAVETQMKLAEEGAAMAGQLDALRDRVAQDGNDLQARFDLSRGLFNAGHGEEAAAELLEIIKRDRGWDEDGARKQLVKYFEAWGPKDPRTAEFRRRLSSILFS